MSAEVFIDSNILIYAHDRNAGERHATASRLLTGFWERGEAPWLSVQVLQETHVNLVRKGVSMAVSAQTVSRYLAWRLIENTAALLIEALAIQQRVQLSFWDAHIVAAALRSGAAELWSEDLNTGQRFGALTIINPLKT